MSNVYVWKRRPFVHQVAAVKTLMRTEAGPSSTVTEGYGGALLMEPRCGKTKTIVDWISILNQQDKVHKVVVVAPLGVLSVWQEEFAANCPREYMLIVWDKTGRRNVLLPQHPIKLTIVVINYDAFATPTLKRRRNAKGQIKPASGRDVVRRQLRRWKPDCMILDESHTIKSPSAKKTLAVIGVAWMKRRSTGEYVCLVPYRAILTGTAVTKKKRVYDIYAQWKFLNPDRFSDTPTFKDFKAEYVRERAMDGYDMWIRNVHEDALRRRIHLDAFAVRRDECFDLPPRRDQPIFVDLDPETARAYDEMAEEMVARIELAKEEGDWKVTASIALVATLRLCQITAGVAKVQNQDGDEKLVRISREKLMVVESILNDQFQADQKIVVASRFRPDLDDVGKWIGKQRGVRYWEIRGGSSRQDKDRARLEFAKHDGPGCMLLHPRAGGQGIDLATASSMVWISHTPSYVDYTQTCDRIALSEKPTFFNHILARGTYDEQLYETLQQDGEVVKAITASPDVLRRNFKVKQR